MRRIGYASVVVTLIIAGLFTAFAVSGTPTTGTVTACATVPAQTISANSVNVGVVAAETGCETVSYTVPTQTETATTTVTTTTTATVPATTTTPPVTTTPPPSSPQASVFVSPTGSDTATNCIRFSSPTTTWPSAATSCATLAKAFLLAQPGDIIQLEPGNYTQNIERNSGADTPRVIVRGDPTMPNQQFCVESQATWQSATPLCARGNVTWTGQPLICGHGFTLEDIDSGDLNTSFYLGKNNQCPGTNQVAANHDITLFNDHWTFQSFLKGTNITIRQNRFGPMEQICNPVHTNADGDGLDIQPDTSGSPWIAPVNIVLDHNLFYDARLGTTSAGAAGPIGPHGCGWGAHTDSVQTLGYNGITVTNNIFWGSVDGEWQDGVSGGTTIGGGVFRNNYFGPSGIDGGNGSIQIGNADPCCSCSGPYTIENNTVEDNVNPEWVDCNGTAGSASVIRNNYVRSESGCASRPGTIQGTWTFNAFGTGSRNVCGTNTKICNPSYVNVPAGNGSAGGFAHGWDLSILPSDTCLRGAADQTHFAASDFYDQARPLGALADLGADEVG